MQRFTRQVRIERQYFQGGVNEAKVRERLLAEGLKGYTWSNGPGDIYQAHYHGYDKVIIVIEGSIKFGFPEEGGTADLATGDRLELPACMLHSAVVGHRGVVCYEAHR